MTVSGPSESELRQSLQQLYSDPMQLERAVAGLRSLGLGSGEISGGSQESDLDLLRQRRCGFPEVVYGAGKSAELVVEILGRQQQAGQDSLVTRVTDEQVALVRAAFPGVIHNAIARTLRLHSGGLQDSHSGLVFVVTAGSSDRAVAEEAMETLRWMRVSCELIQDVGVAGPHRLQQHIPRLRDAEVIVCVAGMEAALPSVLGGYVPCPVIGVPTSVGYGASLEGLTAMLSMLTCCASNVVCVNIDAGFKGGYVAGMIATRRQAGFPRDPEC
jgi:NCAIR mutase (PurE)-related protein